jgi:hypothetical protein
MKTKCMGKNGEWRMAKTRKGLKKAGNPGESRLIKALKR